MKPAFLFFSLILFLSVSLSAVAPAYPHGWGLDSYGCHHNRKLGGYHYHRGPFAGQLFSSKEEMLKKLAAKKPEQAAKVKRKQ